MKQNLRMALALFTLIAALSLASSLPAQTVTSPAITRNDTIVTASSRLGYPAAFDSSRVEIRVCLQTRRAGVNSTKKCSTKTAPWLKRIVVAPPPPPAPPPVVARPLPPTGLYFNTLPSTTPNREDYQAAWPAVSGATSYRYSAGLAGGTGWNGVPDTPLVGETARLLAVPVGASVWFCVWSVNAAGASVANSCAPTQPVTNVTYTATQVGPDSVAAAVQWTNPSTAADSITVHIAGSLVFDSALVFRAPFPTTWTVRARLLPAALGPAGPGNEATFTTYAEVVTFRGNTPHKVTSSLVTLTVRP